MTARPEPVTTNPLQRLLFDWRAERDTVAPFPPGDTRFSTRRTLKMARDPLPLLLDAYRRYGPIFTLRILHVPSVFMLGPEANHYITVSHAANFRWRDGGMGELIPLLGDGLLTIDGTYHKRARRIMLPAFHRERLAATVDTMVEEVDRALTAWRPGEVVDTYAWTRTLALRIAMRALLGLDPDRAEREIDPAHEFERALSYYGTDYVWRMFRGPGTPWWRLNSGRRRLDHVLFGEIARRRAAGEQGEDIMSLLLDARDEDGSALTDQEVRDQMITLWFAGHDTTTSTVAFLLYELARNPAAMERLLEETARELDGRAPTAQDIATGLPELEMAVDETLRLYPPAWIGPRRAVETFEFDGVKVPAGANVNYCSWASHRLPDVFPDPDAFRPERFSQENRAKLPKGAYVPFGGGSRTCIGMRFAQMEIKAIAAVMLQRFRVDLVPGYNLRVRQMPTISPRDGMPMRVSAA